MSRDDKAASAHTDLNTFALIVTILEGGHVYLNESDKVAKQIIDICVKHTDRCLRIYDQSKDDK